MSSIIKFDFYLPAAFEDTPVVKVVHHGRHCAGHLHIIIRGCFRFSPDKTKHLHGIRSGAMWDTSSVEEEEGGKENGLLKLTKHPVATSDAPEQLQDGPNEEIDIEDGVDGERILEEATCAYQ